MITIDRVRNFARKACEFKLTYALIVHEAEVEDATAAKSDIEHITKNFKVHHSAMDAEYGFIFRV